MVTTSQWLRRWLGFPLRLVLGAAFLVLFFVIVFARVLAVTVQVLLFPNIECKLVEHSIIFSTLEDTAEWVMGTTGGTS